MKDRKEGATGCRWHPHARQERGDCWTLVKPCFLGKDWAEDPESGSSPNREAVGV